MTSPAESMPQPPVPALPPGSLRDPAFLSELIGSAYDAALDGAGWTRFAGALNAVCPEGRVSMFVHNTTGRFQDIVAHSGWEPDDLAAYQAYYSSVNPFLVDLPPVGVAGCGMTALRRRGVDLHRTEYYADYLRPRRRGGEVVGVVLERGAGGYASLGLSGHPHRRRQPGLVRLFGLLAPHLRRALAIGRRLETTAGIAPAILDRFTAAVAVLEPDARLRWANQATMRLVAKNDGISLDRDGRLRGADGAVSAALLAAVARAAAPGFADAGTTLPLPRPPPRRPLVASISPLAPALAGASGGGALLLIGDPEQRAALRLEWLAVHYGLTRAELRLVEALLELPRLDDVALRLGVTLGTARDRLKQVLAKTDCHRQAELVRLALTAPDRLIAG